MSIRLVECDLGDMIAEVYQKWDVDDTSQLTLTVDINGPHGRLTLPFFVSRPIDPNAIKQGILDAANDRDPDFFSRMIVHVDQFFRLTIDLRD